MLEQPIALAGQICLFHGWKTEDKVRLLNRRERGLRGWPLPAVFFRSSIHFPSETFFPTTNGQKYRVGRMEEGLETTENIVSSHAVFCGISSPFWNTARDWKLLLPLLMGSVCLNGVSYGPTKPAFMWLLVVPALSLRTTWSKTSRASRNSPSFLRSSRGWHGVPPGVFSRKNCSVSFNSLKSLIEVNVHLTVRDTFFLCSHCFFFFSIFQFPCVSSSFLLLFIFSCARTHKQRLEINL